MRISFFVLTFLLAWPAMLLATPVLPLPVQSALSYRGVPDESLSVYIEALDTGEKILQWHDTVPRNPASVEKMLTTLVALDALGPTYRWKTEVYFLGDVRDGVLDGDILLRGFGDPYLVTERFWQLLRQIRLQGVNEIRGDLLIDDSYFDIGDYDPGAFDREPLRAYNVAPNALLTNFKVVRYYFEPDDGSASVLVTPDPPLDNLEIVNRLRVANGACRGYQRGITITPNQDISTITFSGRFPSGCEIYAMSRTALGHNEFTYGLFKSLWQESGGAFDGGWQNVTLEHALGIPAEGADARATPGLEAEIPASVNPATAALPDTVSADTEPDLVFESLPLTDIITRVNKHSNNVMARQLLYTLGAETFGAPGTEANGRRAVEAWLAERGMDFEELRLANGAGLSRESRMTASHLGELLRYAYESPYMPEYLSSLSLSGLDGTLSRRFSDDSLTGQAHMKTGSLDHVSSVAGYFQSRSGKRYIVVTFLNHTDVHRGPGSEVQEMLLRWLYEH